MTANQIFATSVSVDERLSVVRQFDILKLWDVLLSDDQQIQKSVVRAARSRLNRLIKETRFMDIEFEDHGQDFLRWTLDKNGMVIDSDMQARFWVGGHVADYRNLMAHVPPMYQSKVYGGIRHVNYPLKKIYYWKGNKHHEKL